MHEKEILQIIVSELFCILLSREMYSDTFNDFNFTKSIWMYWVSEIQYFVQCQSQETWNVPLFNDDKPKEAPSLTAMFFEWHPVSW